MSRVIKPPFGGKFWVGRIHELDQMDGSYGRHGPSSNDGLHLRTFAPFAE